MNSESSPLSGYIYLLLAQATVGGSIVLSKFLVGSLSPITILHVRFLVSFLVLITLHFLFGRQRLSPLKTIDKKSWGFMVAQALCAGAIFNLFLLTGLQFTSASVAGIITSTLPAVIAIMSVIFLREKLRLFTALCIGCSVLGLIVINAHNLSAESSGSLLGDAFVLLSMLPEGAYYILSKINKNRLPIFLAAALMNGINIPVFALLEWFSAYPMLPQVGGLEFALLILLSLTSAGFYVFWFLGYQDMSSTAAGLTTAFAPIVTLFIAWLFLNETISGYQLAGMVLVIASITFNAISPRRARSIKP